ncbi:hypothetical protein PPL_05759 [Heterostelium album PN500]|uniref:Uncharacterized protein n=1 Tax=Heterostelium pallidum (strain ATCC 26659 / Pp 5 / PN500) TaxID=670386 RepID=D3BB27_HETP5|nr:hypothetical protein PPL_05759 [Heterostelium album PN500]EFA81764.1 hypothetical protein PPL_05759 [Heterostelium album PN500]|eukprot:XP_020433881.1 hypothetical protein PPL_05759 [Heterostelium album PN500]
MIDLCNKNSDSLVLSGDTDSLSSVIIAGTDSIPVEIDTASNYVCASTNIIFESFLTAKKKCEGCTQYPPHYKSTPTAENIMCDSPYCHSIGNVCEKQSKFDPATCSFVSQLENGASIREQTDGPTLTKAIFGVGPNCPNCPPSPLYSILSTLKKPYIFGISLDRNYFGGISLGLIDPLLYTKTINYTNMLKNDGLYAMTPILKSVWNNATWNSDRIQVPKVVLKSTSTLSYLPTDAFQSFKTFLKLNCGAKEMCAKMENLFTSIDCF